MIDTGPSFIADYLVKKWSPAGNGPEDFNCYNLVRDVYQTQWNVSLPEYMISADDILGLARAMRDEVLTDKWVETEKPDHGSVALFTYRIEPVHIGIWLDYDTGLVLHSAKGFDITCTNLLTLKSYGFIKPRFYNYVRETS